MKKSLIVKLAIAGAACVLVGAGIYLVVRPKSELKSIKSEAELYSFYDRSVNSDDSEYFLRNIFLLPFSFGTFARGGGSYYYSMDSDIEYNGSVKDMAISGTSSESTGSSREYSTTNIQVENVDEADIIKTDGDYMYSISDSDVVITNVKNTSEPSVAARINSLDGSIPEDLILADNTLTVIGAEYKGNDLVYSRYRHYNKNNTTVRIYDISDRTNPRLVKNYKLNEPYYTSRRVDSKLYVVASGNLRQKTGEKLVEHSYYEDYVEKEYALGKIHYLDDVYSSDLTLISVFDLNDPDGEIEIEPFLLDISNAYVSENAFYLLDEKFGDSDESVLKNRIKMLFGFGGIISFFNNVIDESYDYEYDTNIYKFNIEKSGAVSYAAKARVAGTTINQYSVDEKDGHLRVALNADAGSYVAIFDEKMNIIGESGRLAEDERMYASRFIGDKAYLVTYRNTDPLFVIDLSNESNPKVLGELKIPGYSVYLHPYDENHLIGIGMDTEEVPYKDVNGRIISYRAYITGMKMALFDISDFKNPKEISKLHIGDRRTSSAILSNPKALLFSKEKSLIGIPVNGYESDFKVEVSESSTTLDLYNRYSRYGENYVREGYIIYNVDTENGISQHGEIIHEDSSLVRGAYIDDDLLTVSNKTLKVNDLNTLEQKAELDLGKEN